MKKTLTFRCKVCSEDYELSQEELLKGPVWALEVCSKSCNKTCSKKRLLMRKPCLVLPEGSALV